MTVCLSGPLDTFVSELGGTILHRPLDEVIAELEAQQAAAEEAEKAARKAIRKQKKQESKETFNSAWTRWRRSSASNSTLAGSGGPC